MHNSLFFKRKQSEKIVVRKSFKTAIESLAMLARICQKNNSPTSTTVLLSLGKVCRITMQEPSNSRADNALASTALEKPSRLPLFRKTLVMTSPVKLSKKYLLL